jgi:hypothetical protein
VLLLLLAALAAPRVAAQEMAIRADDERPLRGQAVRLTVTEDGRPAAGARVSALYRPNSHTEHRSELAAVDSSGTVLWTPEYTGPVTLEVRPAGTEADADADADAETPPVAPSATLTVAVRYGSLPPSGLFIMVLAGLLLFGGAAVSMLLLLRPPDHIPPSEPPST